MSHKEQKDYFKIVKDRFPQAFKNKKVLDIGSYDLNGTNAYLFDDSEVIGLDIAAGPGVDIVCEGQKYDAPDESYDAIVSSECWEHNPYYKETIQNAVRMLKSGGFFLFACATTGRPVHGLASQQEEMLRNDPTWTVMPSARLDNWETEYYYNVDENDVRDAIDVDGIFSSYEFVVEEEHCDLYFWGFKKMKKRKVVIDKKYVLENAYDDFVHMLTSMPSVQRQVQYINPAGPTENYRLPGIADTEHPSGMPGSDYPFYGYFSTLVDNTTILEIGTCHGGSAVMMSHNKTNKVITYDIYDLIPGPINRKNIEFRVGNFMEDETINYDEIDLMTLDVDPHDGVQEPPMIEFLEKNWKGGLLVLDDIHNGSGMEKFWYGIDRERHGVYDVSDVGHAYHGTGLINFNRYFDLEVLDYNRDELEVETCDPIHENNCTA